MSEPRRVLVLTSRTGAGHDTHARAFCEWAAHRYGDRVQVRVEHVLEDSSWLLRQGVRLYNAIQRTAPWTHHIYYQFVEMRSLLHADDVALGRRPFVRLLETFRPSVILSVHDCTNRGYFALARRVLGPATRCVTFCLEFQGGYGCSRNWADSSADLFLGRTPATAEFGVRQGIPRERCRVLGNLLPRRFYAMPLTVDERARYLTERCGFSAERFTLLLATGGAGAENHAAFLEVLKPLDVQVIALCGDNRAPLERIETWRARNPGFALRALAFTDEMPQLLQASSAVVARAGVIAAEALLCSCPPIFNALGGAMPQELPTIRYFRDRQIASTVTRAAHLAPIVHRWLAHRDEYKALRERLATCRLFDDPKRLVAEIMGEGH